MPKLDISLKITKSFILLYLTLFISAIGGILMLPMALIFKVLLIALAVIYTLIILYNQSKWQALHCYQNKWYMKMQNQVVPIQLSGQTLITNWVSLLHFKTPDFPHHYSYVLFKTDLPQEKYRQFLVCIGNYR